MELTQIREMINALDDTMHQTFLQRLNCSAQVAEVKLQTGDCVYKPQREQEILARFSGEEDEAVLYRLYIRKVMQLSRYYQYGQMLQHGRADAAFEKEYEVVEAMYAQGKYDPIEIVLTADATSGQGLSLPEILSLLGDFGIKVLHMESGETQVNIRIHMVTEQNPETAERQKRFLYMLYKECIACKIKCGSMFQRDTDKK